MVCLCAVDHLTNWNLACRVAWPGTAEENELPLAGIEIHFDVSNAIMHVFVLGKLYSSESPAIGPSFK